MKAPLGRKGGGESSPCTLGASSLGGSASALKGMDERGGSSEKVPRAIYIPVLGSPSLTDQATHLKRMPLADGNLREGPESKSGPTMLR